MPAKIKKLYLQNIQTKSKHNIFQIILLILAGEATFILPFVLVRIFRSTYIEVFDITNEQLGYCFSIYGLVAIGAYLLGGYIADKFKPSYLIAGSLFLTAMGGFYLATIPSYTGLFYLFAFWGASTILLMWSAIHKATRIWGGQDNQCKAFGFLDGGRGLVSFIIGLVTVYVFSLVVAGPVEDISLSLKKEAMQQIFILSSVFVAASGLLILFFLKNQEQESSHRFGIKDFINSFKYPQIYLLAGIVVCAYSAYRLTDLIPTYAVEMVGMSDEQAATTSTFLLLLRAGVGIAIGLLIGRRNPFKIIITAFSIITILVLSMIMMNTNQLSATLFLMSVSALALGVYAARVMYFAVLQNSKIPLAITGTAIGIISIIGYTPDIFFGAITGHFLDQYDYQLGFTYTFIFVGCLSLLGLLLTFILTKFLKNG